MRHELSVCVCIRPADRKTRCQTEAIKKKIIIIPVKCASWIDVLLDCFGEFYFCSAPFRFVSHFIYCLIASKSWIFLVVFVCELRFSKRITKSHSLSVRVVPHVRRRWAGSTRRQREEEEEKTDSIDKIESFFFNFFSFVVIVFCHRFSLLFC